MMVQAAFGDRFEPELKIVNDSVSDVFFEVHSGSVGQHTVWSKTLKAPVFRQEIIIRLSLS